MYMIIFNARFLNYPQVLVISEPKTRVDNRVYFKSPGGRTLSLTRDWQFLVKPGVLSCLLELQL